MGRVKRKRLEVYIMSVNFVGLIHRYLDFDKSNRYYGINWLANFSFTTQ